MTAIRSNTELTIVVQPQSTMTSDPQNYPSSDENHIVSANLPIPIVVKWANTSGSAVSSTYNPTTTGDVVNVIIEVFAGNKFGTNQSISSNKMKQIATLKKSRDLPYLMTDMGTNMNVAQPFQYFSFDLQSICADLLSYTLAPIKSGTIKSVDFGGYNGDTSSYIQGDNNPILHPLGAFRFIDFQVKAEVLNSDGEVVSMTGSALAGTSFCIVNNVPQWTDSHNLHDYAVVGGSGAEDTSHKFFSYCPNAATSDSNVPYKKPIRMTDEAEWLHFFIQSGIFASSDDKTADAFIKIETSNGASAELSAFKALIPSFGVASNAVYKSYLIQNVSPVYINSITSNTISDDTVWYKATLVLTKDGPTDFNYSESRYFVIDRQPVKPAYDFVRFHWLNRAGGIDSYTCTRDVTESISVSKNTFEQRPNQRMLPEEGSLPISYSGLTYVTDNLADTNFSNTYQESVRVLNVDATKNESVYTEPMNKTESDWLSELITSPSVWIELENDASIRANAINATMHPSTKDYFPVIITNSSVETVNQEQGLVKFNIEYTHSHKINTQRN
tara:strand:- start:6587 stop:8260 length:1674 start_codon:yes stop_codon:yes gene_type:complete